MITGLRAQNFKSWKDTGELRIAPLTGLFGTNSSGKTSILQALLLLKQSAEMAVADPSVYLYLGDDRTLVNLGSYPDVIFGHNTALDLQLSIWWRAPSGRPGRVEIGVEESEDRLRLKKFLFHEPEGAGDVKATAVDSHFWAFVPPLAARLRDVHYLGPLRFRPQRAPYVWSGSAPWDVGPDGAKFALALRANPGLAASVGRALCRLRLAETFRLEPVGPERRDFEIRLKKSSSSAEVLLPDVGFGISQVLPVLVLCYYAEEKSTLVIEQPELHLHPAAQSELADVLIDVVKNRNIQIILESHSEHLLRRLQRRIAEGTFEAGDAALYFCEMEDGASKCTPLELTDEGFIRNWPKDFFGDEMGELAAITEEAMKRRLAKAK